MPTRKTIVVPCIVKKRLKTSGGSTVLFGATNWMRIINTMNPAKRKKTREVQTYIKPSFL